MTTTQWNKWLSEIKVVYIKHYGAKNQQQETGRCNFGQWNVQIRRWDDTYLIVPTCNVGSRICLRLRTFEAWEKTNNLALNRTKSWEIVVIVRADDQSDLLLHFHRCRMLYRVRVTTLKVLGIIDTLSTYWRREVIMSFALTNALSFLRTHGLSNRLFVAAAWLYRSSGRSSLPR